MPVQPFGVRTTISGQTRADVRTQPEQKLDIIAGSGCLQVAGVLLPPLQTLLGTEPLTIVELLACATVAVIPGLALRLVRR